MKPQMLILQGTVVHKRRESEPLPIAVATPEGTNLAAFQKQIVEMDLPIGQGTSARSRFRNTSYSFLDRPFSRCQREHYGRAHSVVPEGVPFFKLLSPRRTRLACRRRSRFHKAPRKRAALYLRACKSRSLIGLAVLRYKFWYKRSFHEQIWGWGFRRRSGSR